MLDSPLPMGLGFQDTATFRNIMIINILSYILLYKYLYYEFNSQISSINLPAAAAVLYLLLG